MLRWPYLQQKAVAFRARPPHRESRASLQALKNLIAEADLILETCPPLPEKSDGCLPGGSTRCPIADR